MTQESAPRVSIGVPVYNGENYLAAALDCLLAQTYGDFEIIVADNASTDGTAAICQEYAARDARIRIERAPQNGGLIWNFNRLVSLARGEYFTWAAHDDLREPTFLERCLAVLDADSSVVLCHGRTACVDAQGRMLRADQTEYTTCAAHDMTLEQEAQRTVELLSAAPAERLSGVLMHTTMPHEIYGLIRTSVLRETPLMRPFFGSDMVLVAEIGLRGKISVWPEVLFFSRSHAAQASLVSGEPDPPAAFQRTPRFSVPRKVRYPWELAYAIHRSPLSAAEKLRCLLVVARFGMQVKKWRRVGQDLLQRLQRREMKTNSTMHLA